MSYEYPFVSSDELSVGHPFLFLSWAFESGGDVGAAGVSISV